MTATSVCSLEQLLLEGLNSPASEMTAQDWQEIRREVRERLAQRQTEEKATEQASG